ncbi:MAG: bifunctional oligoribonuclease/PAP phosphatase NrnA [Candidatus Zixiibacteriota bacterium]|nr:MAG: bifunctional oligoribonuclease/PAP phosphatase NrnA [candidate division Zixibacteria bacterium]
MTQKSNIVVTDAAPPYEAIMAVLDSSDKILVASHLDPDGDAIGTQLAFAAFLKHVGKDVYTVRDNDIPFKYRFLSGVNEIPRFDAYRGNELFDAAVILECPNLSRIGRARSLLNGGIRVINIDHHRDNDLFGEVNWLNSEASSVGEMTYELFQLAGYSIPPAVAEQLYTAIMTDTGRFRYRSTSPRAMEIAGELIEAGADPQKICDHVYYNLQPSTMKLIGKVLNSIEFHHDGTICLLTLTKEMLSVTGADESESDGLVDYTLFNAGVRAGALLKEIDANTTKISFRSKDGINVAAIAARFGGGGHYNASGCTLGMPIEEARGKMLKILEKEIDRLE